jgi:secreted trypsin-like serine protease
MFRSIAQRRRLLPLAATAALFASALPTFAPSPANAIVGGQGVQAGDLSFVAEVRNTAVGGLCTGSLIHPRYVLTAAHCSVPTKTTDMSVRVGNNQSWTGGELRVVKRIVRHPSYQGGHNDLAVLELDRAITNITPVRLGTPAEAHRWDGYQGGPFTKYDDGIAVGWGGTDTNVTLPNQLQFTGTYITPSQNDDLGIKRLMVDRGPCQGDSGGPLLVGDGNGGLIQAGVLKGAACGGGGSYSEVGAGPHRTWVLNQLRRKLLVKRTTRADIIRLTQAKTLAQARPTTDIAALVTADKTAPTYLSDLG